MLKKLYSFWFVIVLPAFWVSYKFNPGGYSFFPKCPFYLLTGLDCPGCGSQRAVHALLHGDVKAAMDYNLLLVITLPFLAIHFFYKIVSFKTGKEYRWSIIEHPYTPVIVFIMVLIFTVLRNIPSAPFSYLAA